MKENIYIVYSETKQNDNPKWSNGNTIQADGPHELLHAIREAITEKKENLIIHTITNGKPQ